MEAKELRIGNYILYLDELYIVDGIKYEEKSTDKWRIAFRTVDSKLRSAKMLSWIKPVPLSLDILEKAGFEKTIDEDGGEVFRKGEFEIEYYILSAADTGFYYSNNTSKETFLQYAHQLQNLLFALTGTDLSLQL